MNLVDGLISLPQVPCTKLSIEDPAGNPDGQGFESSFFPTLVTNEFNIFLEHNLHKIYFDIADPYRMKDICHKLNLVHSLTC